MKKSIVVFSILFFTLLSPSTVFASAPMIYSIDPTGAIADSDITLRSGYPGFGSHVGAVYINGNIIDTSSWTDSKIVAHIPMGTNSGTYNLTVRNSIGEESSPKQISIQLPPEISYISPSQIYPGITRMCIVGNNFGTSESNWSGVGANSTIKVGGIEITSASWTNNKICFASPTQMSSGGLVTLQIKSYPAFTKTYSLARTGSSQYAKVSANDTLIRSQYYLDVLGVHDAWNTRSTSPNVVVAVIDDGIYLNHPDLKNNIWENSKEVLGNKKDDDKNGYVDDVYGYNFIDDNGEVTAKGDHGTHVAGIIGAMGNNGQGIAGMSWNVKLMSLIVCDDSGCNRDAIIKAIKYAADNGANVINLSLGSKGTMGYSASYDDAVRYAYNKGVVIVAATGNGDIESAESIGVDLNNVPQSPVCNDLTQNAVLGVSGIDDQKNALRWANYGTCADVYAPGTQILSTAVPALNGGAFYTYMSGTSFSSPIVAGLAALIKAQFPKITNREIIDRIIQTSTNDQGIRTVNAFSALTAAYTPSNDNPIIPSPVTNDPLPTPPPPTKIVPTPKVETAKPKVQSDTANNSTNKASVFVYDGKMATSTPATNMSVTISATLRSCPANTCDAKGVYPVDTLFIVKEKYGIKETWYRGETPDGNIGWLSSDSLTLSSAAVSSQEVNTQASTTLTTPLKTPTSPSVTENKKQSFWAKVVGWLHFWK
jgi:subtilisin family serine protease